MVAGVKTWFRPPPLKRPPNHVARTKNLRKPRPTLVRTHSIGRRLVDYGRPVMIHGVKTYYFTLLDISKALNLSPTPIKVAYKRGFLPEPYDYIQAYGVSNPIFLIHQVRAICRVYGHFYANGFVDVNFIHYPEMAEMMKLGAKLQLEHFFESLERKIKIDT